MFVVIKRIKFLGVFWGKSKIIKHLIWRGKLFYNLFFNVTYNWGVIGAVKKNIVAYNVALTFIPNACPLEPRLRLSDAKKKKSSQSFIYFFGEVQSTAVANC